MKLKIIAICFALAGLSACKKDILDTPPLNKISDEEVWKDLNYTESFVNEKYQVLPHFNIYNNLPSHMGYSAVSDETYNKFNGENVNRISTGALNPDNLALDSWTVFYNYIRDLNILMSRIDDVPGDATKRDRIKGEGMYLRAYCYFDLATKYGGVPLITKVYNATDKDFVEKRATYEEVVKFVVDQLDAAAPLLPDSYTAGKDIGRATKGACLALKSRMLLYAASPLWNASNDQTKWKAAADAAKAVIDMPQYTLYQGADYHQLFLEGDNSEVIISNHQNAVKYKNYIDIHLSPNGYHGWSAYTPTQHIVDQFEMKTGKLITDPTSGYDAQNPYVDRDPRFYTNIIFDGAQFRDRPAELFQGGKDSPQSTIENWNASLTGYNWKKYNDESYDLNTQAVGSKTAFIISRLSEIYLNYAEALNAMGNDPEALIWLNKIRQRPSVNMPAVTATGTALRDAIRHEREVELCLEGHRFFDVRRWKIAEVTDNKPAMGIKITKAADGKRTFDYTLKVQDRKFIAPQHYLFPIPKYELDKIKLDQNPGYQN